MRRITLWSLSTLTTLVLLFSYHTSTPSKAAPGAAPVVAQAAPGAVSTTSASSKTYDGEAVSTRFGDVQVQITVADGRITAAQVLQVPWSDHRDQEINAYAVPILNQEAVSSQSSGIDMVSGATYTSDGYIRSLQSAIDQAHL